MNLTKTLKAITSEKTQDMLMEWGVAALTFIVGLVVTIIIVKLVRRALKKTKLEPILQSFVVSATRVVCLIMVAVITLEKVGVSPSSFITVMGVTGAAVALAVKDTLSNIAGGLMIIATHPFKQGDLVEIDSKLGFVEKTTLVRTSLRTYDNRVIEVPNNTMSNAILINYSAKDIRRVDLDIHVKHGTDMRKLEGLLMAVCDSTDLVLKEPAPSFGVRSVAEGFDGIDFMVWTNTENYWDTYYFMHETADMAMDEAGIERPLARHEVYLKK